MYIDNIELDKPAKNAKIWRYMDHWKFSDMLATSSLHFTRVDKLDDNLEGTWGPSGAFEAYESYGKEYIEQLKYWEKVFRTIGAVNCWHVNNSESEEMWNLYVSGNEGVAVQSTFSALTKAFDTTARKIYVGIMKYIDYEHDSFEDCSNRSFGNFTTFFNYKDENFKHENELRALIMAMGTKSEPAQPLSANGTKVHINVAEIIEGIYTPTSKVNLLQKEFSDYGVAVQVIPSAILT